MKLSLTILFLSIGSICIGQNIAAWTGNLTFGKTEPSKFTADTTEGMAVCLIDKSLDVYKSVKIDSTEHYYGMVGCPDNRPGCFVLHYGWRKYVFKTEYLIWGQAKVDYNTIEVMFGKPIDEKYIIKFVPNN